jgi:hypothetical protein
MGPTFHQDMLDTINMSLFEVSENDNIDPRTFYTSVASICTSAGIAINDVTFLNFDSQDFEAWPEVARLEGGKPLFLYVTYTREPYFVSHAEIVDQEDLDDIMALSSLKESFDDTDDNA